MRSGSTLAVTIFTFANEFSSVMLENFDFVNVHFFSTRHLAGKFKILKFTKINNYRNFRLSERFNVIKQTKFRSRTSKTCVSFCFFLAMDLETAFARNFVPRYAGTKSLRTGANTLITNENQVQFFLFGAITLLSALQVIGFRLCSLNGALG